MSSYLSEVPVGNVWLNLAFLSHSTICLLIGDVPTLTVTADMVEFASIVLLLVFYFTICSSFPCFIVFSSAYLLDELHTFDDSTLPPLSAH